MAEAPEIPKTYKAAIYDEPGKISTKIVELETPEPGAGQVLVKLYVLVSISNDNNPFLQMFLSVLHPACVIQILGSC